MPNPTMNDVHTSALLSNVSIAYRNPSYIASQIFPRIRVEKQTDNIAVYTKSDWFRINAQVWAPGAKKPVGEYRIGTALTYNCVPWSLAKVIGDDVVANADAPFRPRVEATEWLTDQIELAYEYRVASQVFSATQMSGYTAGVTALTGGAQVAWDTYETSDPIKDIRAMKALIRGQIAREPNLLVMGVQVWDKLQDHPDLLDRMKYTQTGILSEAMFANMIDMPRVLIGRSMYAANEEGSSSQETLSYIWGKSVLLAWIPDRPSLLTPSLGYTFAWGDRATQEYRYEEEEATKVAVTEWVDEKLLLATCGYLITSVVS